MKENPKSVRLLKTKKVKGDKTYNNLYIQIGDGNPIAIELVHWNYKVRNLLLANATDFEISRVLQVSTEGKADEGNGK